MYAIVLKPLAIAQFNEFKKAGNAKLIHKIERLLIELAQHPRTGTGQIEQLKHELAGYWSRRINSEHRMVYCIKDSEVIVEVITLKGHYKL